MVVLKTGQAAPRFEALDQNGKRVCLEGFAGRKLFLFFYPRANTSGCTTQAVSVRDALSDLNQHGVDVIGISPDLPEQQKKFDQKNGLGFSLLSDPEHTIAAAYGVWGEKKMYGKSFMGIVRSSFLIDEKGCVLRSWYKISPKNTVPEVMKALVAR